jgi:hypothetical protein
MEQKLLDIRLQMEALICEREGMIALNKEREHSGYQVAYNEAAFLKLADLFNHLIENLRNIP